ncbi:MFS transporter [Candidatus Sumerlaeota bacterium]|nr:MFS transporter [Candidatus Sumerlaeota bacterium]
MVDARGKRKSPWYWVGSLYYAEGIPYILAMTVSTIMYKKMGISNTDIAFYTSWLYLPWVIKPLWSPFVDMFKTKRWWIVIMQLILGLGMAGVAIVIPLPNFFKISIYFLFLIAFSSATHDIACDGFYMLGLTKHQQAWFVGVRSTFYRLAMLTGQGLLVVFAGLIEANTGLENLDVKVAAVVESKPPMEYVRFVDIAEEEKKLLETKTHMEKLDFYLKKTESAENLDGAASSAFNAYGVLSAMRKENPDDARIPDAESQYQAICDSLNRFLLEDAEKMSADVKTLDGDLRLIVSEKNLEIPIQYIPKKDAEVTFYMIKRLNILQGQAEEKERAIKAKKPNFIKRNWSEYVAKPLGGFLKKFFGEEVKTPPAVLGNIGYLQIHLSKPPESGRKVTVNFGRSKGDKSIDLKEGTRFEFTEKNWNKPVKAAIQLDHRLKDESESFFKGTAGNIPLSWISTFILCAALFLFFGVYHFLTLPHPVSDTSRYMESKAAGKPFTMDDVIKEFFDTFVSFFKKKGIIYMILFLCFYRFAEAQLVKMYGLFLLDPQEKGGLALTTGQVGIAYGTVGLVCLSIGGILGGFVAARDGLKKWLFFMCLAINIPDLVYVYMSYALPDSFAVICTCVGFETFGYGFGYTAYMLYMIFIAEGEHKTAHFALATGFMALGMMIPGMFSGWLQSNIGYRHFFIWVMIATIPGFLTLLLIPLDAEFGKKKKEVKA